MVDLSPPRLDGNERETLQALLQFQRESFVRKAGGIDDEAAQRRFVGSETTLLWLTKHLAFAESIWVCIRFADQALDLPDRTCRPTDSIADAVEEYRRTWARVDAVVAGAASLDAVCRNIDAPPNVNLRWVLGHLLEETARHAGHADILREFLDGETGR